MPYDAAMARARGEWAVKEWQELPLETRIGLLPCLRAVDEGFSVVQLQWIEFCRTRPMRVWEAAALRDIVVSLVRDIDGVTRAQVIDGVKLS